MWLRAACSVVAGSFDRVGNYTLRPASLASPDELARRAGRDLAGRRQVSCSYGLVKIVRHR
jgi:hypothetical protein